ncbi:MAG: EamA family transporter [Bacteriovoracaceae bacterium]|nr:EamA family transporter [Bacteriovoracaceae bacterium]
MNTWVMISLISAIFSALAAVTQKRVLNQSNPLRFTTVLAIFNLILLLPFPFIFSFSSVSVSTLGVVIFKTMLSGTAFLMVMEGIKRAEISNALPLLVLTPGVVAVIAFFFLGEQLSFGDMGGVLLLVVGAGLLQYSPKSLRLLGTAKERRGIYYILIALTIFSITAVLDKVILKRFRVPPMDYWFYQHLILFVFFSLISFVGRRDSRGVIQVMKRSWKLILIISLLTLVYRYSFIAAVKMAPVALVLSLKRLSVLMVAIFGGMYFKEHSLRRRAIATSILLVGAGLIALK